ncbi:hypothetical protein AALA61_14960 [Oscillospiraceae bacterium 42-9]
MKYGEFPLITIDELTDLEMLKNHVLYSDEYKDMVKTDQEKIYHYCKIHATFRGCIENLRQIQYAITEIYFGY